MGTRPAILLVEDDEDLRNAIGGALEQSGYETQFASNGREALDALLREEVEPSLILLDLRMPVMDGWEFARVIRCYKRLAAIPIVVISTPSGGPLRHPRVDGVLPKPFTMK